MPRAERQTETSARERPRGARRTATASSDRGDAAAHSALQTYRAKRDFARTPEPAEGGAADESARAFVIQKHWARRLHYDFRLELEGTMKSWAVPKGPSLDPADKRMAMPTEDHPIAYNRFEGEIPAGNYGAGKVIIWDKGVWLPLDEDPGRAWRAGKLKFALHGHKLQGTWNLVRMKGRGGDREDPWLLIKERDAHARQAAQYSVTDALPDSVAHLPDRPQAPPAENAANPPQAAAPSREAAPRAAARARHAPAASRSEAPAAQTRPPEARACATSAREARGTRARASAAPAPDAAAASGPPAGARRAPLPATLKPQLAVLADSPPPDASGTWIYEIKFDGYRILTRAEGGQLRLFTRNGNDWTHRMPQLHTALAAMDLPDGWYDGEIILPGSHAPADFQALQGAFDSQRARDIVYYMFDLPWCAGHDLRAVPLEARREVLQRIVARKPQPQVRFSEEFDAPAQDVVASACRLGLEGVIAKRRGSHYSNERSADWLKLKCGLRQEFVIGGFTDPKGSRTGLGALLLGVHGPDGALHYAGNVGTGFTQDTLAELRTGLDELVTSQCPFSGGGRPAGRPHWVRPELIAEVAFSEWTRDGRVRHGVFHGLRSDKPAAAITREQAVSSSAAGAREAPARRTRDASARGKGAAPPATPLPPAQADALLQSLRVTHPERLVDTASGVTKMDLVRYYAQVADLMLPHLAGRPVSLVRAPGGIDGELFFQKHSERYTIAGIDDLDRALDPGHPPLLTVARPEGLVHAAQMNVVEFHTWNAVAQRIAEPDRMTFDIDPGEGITWSQIQQSGLLVRALLEELGLPAFLKTSGGKGLHVVVPLAPRFDWGAVKEFSQAVVQHLARTLPERFVARSGPRNRVGRIFIDYLRNGFGATTVAAWSARARPGLGISVPVGWDELQELTGGAHWTVRTVQQRLARGNTPWDGYDAQRADLREPMRKLGFSPRA
ncbi:DNA ligase D [Ramlibacter sp. AN1015]|uniref:DNA ligase D n=1 Tax=Ramlibacter sp. AN1015 TaxID=3133428 RepID=UPI0030BA649B